MIAKNCAYLYRKVENNINITVRIGKTQKISTYWYVTNLKRSHLHAKENYKKYSFILHALKINGCAKCGYNKCDANLDFHHTNPKDKKFPLSMDSMRRKNELIAVELNKCILLCCRCHGEVHAKERLNE